MLLYRGTLEIPGKISTVRVVIGCQNCLQGRVLGFVLFFNFLALQGKYARKTFRFLLHIGLASYCTYSKKQLIIAGLHDCTAVVP